MVQGVWCYYFAIDGNNSTQIARIFNEKGIPTKTQMRHPERAGQSGRMQAWDNVSVRAVLNNRFYLGEMDYGKSKRKYVGSKGSIAVSVEDWKVIPNHHEPLVSPDDYEKVCLFRKGADTTRKGEQNPLVGKLFCGGCGYFMTYKPYGGRINTAGLNAGNTLFCRYRSAVPISPPICWKKPC